MSAEIIIFPGVCRPNPVNRIGLERTALVERYTGGIKCAVCGDQIPPSRLKAKPNATRCVDCQFWEELKGWGSKRFEGDR